MPLTKPLKTGYKVNTVTPAGTVKVPEPERRLKTLFFAICRSYSNSQLVPSQYKFHTPKLDSKVKSLWTPDISSSSWRTKFTGLLLKNPATSFIVKLPFAKLLGSGS